MNKETLQTESLSGMMPICPSCGHHNAMLGPSRGESRDSFNRGWNVFTCRDCGYKCEAVNIVEIK